MSNHSYYHRKQRGHLPSDKDEESHGSGSSSSNVAFSQRIDHFTWAWFAFPLSTGGIGLLLNDTPNQFEGLKTIGKIFFIFAIVVTLSATAAITIRFTRRPSAFRRSLAHPTEGLFFPVAILNLANLISCAQTYGGPNTGPWFVVAMRIIFWTYAALAFLAAVLHYLYLFTAPNRLTIHSMTPAWILPVFPSMLSGTLASVIASSQPPGQRLPMIVAGVAFQGLGFMIAFLMYAIYIHRLMEFGLPSPDLRPALFISVGPPSFTGLALIGISLALPENYGYFASHTEAIAILQVLALFIAIFLWMLAFWFCCLTICAVLISVRTMSFHLAWWSFVFPNVGFAIATTKIGQQLGSPGVSGVASTMTILLVALWIFLFVCTIRAVLKQQILMPGKDEDKEDHKVDDGEHGKGAPR